MAGSALMALAVPSTAGAVTVAAPTVTSLNPTSGTTTGGTLVEVFGTNFTTATTVQFGSGAGTGVIYISATTLVAYTPAESAGVVNVTVTTAGGTSATSAVDQFTYVVTPTFADDSGHGNTGSSAAGVVAGVSGPLSGTQSASFSGALEAEVNTAVSSASPQNFSLEGWFKTTSTSGGSIIGFTNTKNGVGSTADDRMVWMDNAGHLDFAVAPGDRAQQIISTQTTSTAYNNGAWHFMVASVGTGGMELFVDGHLVAQNTAVTTAEAYSGWWYLGFAGEDLGGWTDTPADGYWNGDLADLAVIPSQLTAAQVTTLSGATTGPAFLSDTTALSPSSYWPMYAVATVVSPTIGSASGGTPVTITGTGFVSGSTVQFGASAATNVMVASPTSVTATAPAGTAGAAVTVTVTAPGGAASVGSPQFTYATAPTVSAVNPTVGPTAGGTSVTISGTGFVSGATVRFGSNAATNVVVAGASTITATAPAGTAGAVNVTVTVPAGTSAVVSADQFTYGTTPTVSALNPVAGPTAGGTPVTITGTGFVSGATVHFGPTAATNVVVVSATTITATAPAGAAGAVNVTVTTPTGTSATGPANQFTYDTPPTVTGLSPASGLTTGGTSVTITGTGFVSGATVRFGSNAATNVVVGSATSLTATAPAGAAGAVNVTVVTPGGTSPVVVADQFTYGATPTVTALNPAAGPTAAGTLVTVTGSGFVTGATVRFGSNAATNVVVASSTTITASAPAGTAGSVVNVTVTVPAGTSATGPANQFTYDALPSVTAVSPTFGPASGGTSLTITGTGFVSGTAVLFGASAATNVVVSSATSLTATAPAGTAGVINVTVTTPGGTSATGTANQFTYDATPTVTGLSPASGLTTGGTSVTITGTGFVSGATVLFGTTPGTAVVVAGPTTITVTDPARAVGAVYVTVTTPGGTSATTAANQFSYVTYPLAPLSVTATQAAPAPDLTVTWTPSTGGTLATGALVQLYQLVSGAYVYRQEIICGGSCTSTIFRELTVGATYAALVWPTITQGPGSPAASGPITLTTTCGAGACVTLNANQAIGPANHAASGILSSVFNIGTLVADLVGLNTTMFRSAPPPIALGLYDWTSWNEAVAAGAQTTLVLSDEYSAAYGGSPPTPWSNWTAYNTEIKSLVSTLAASGEPINYWEVYNEPGGNDSYYSAAGYATETPALLLQQFLDTYQDIRSVVPNAAIIGPSLEHWSDYPGQYGTADHAFDMVTFLNFAAANSLSLAAISWHEIDDNLGTKPEENSLAPAMIEDHVSEARRLIAGLPQLGNPKIFINEYGMPEVQTIPGWDVAYLAALTDAGVNSADRACWGTCASPSLDGLLTLAGLSTPTYYERLVYAATSGNMIATTSSVDSVNALGSFNSATGVLTALIGRGVGCSQNATCAANWPAALDAAPTSVTVTITVPWTSGTAALALSDFEGQTDTAVTAPTPVDSTATVVPNGSGGGTVTFSIPAFADGDAYGLSLTHSAS